MSDFHPFSTLPKELRLKIYSYTFEPRLLQLGVDAAVPFPSRIKMLGGNPGLSKRLHTPLPALFGVCTVARDFSKSVFVAFGSTYIHPYLDNLYIPLYAIGRMMTPQIQLRSNDTATAQYELSAFKKTVIEFGLEELLQDPEAWTQRPKTQQTRNGVKALCPPRRWPITDYAELFRFFGLPKNIEIVGNAGKML